MIKKTYPANTPKNEKSLPASLKLHVYSKKKKKKTSLCIKVDKSYRNLPDYIIETPTTLLSKVIGLFSLFSSSNLFTGYDC